MTTYNWFQFPKRPLNPFSPPHPTPLSWFGFSISHLDNRTSFLTCLPASRVVHKRICPSPTSDSPESTCCFSFWVIWPHSWCCVSSLSLLIIKWIMLSCWLNALQWFSTKPKITTNSFLWPTISWMTWTCLAQVTVLSHQAPVMLHLQVPQTPPALTGPRATACDFSPYCIELSHPLHGGSISSWGGGRPSLTSKVDLPPQPAPLLFPHPVSFLHTMEHNLQ